MSWIDWLEPNWPAPHTVRAVSTTRHGGVSTGVWATLNLGDHVGDDPAAVEENRQRLIHEMTLPVSPGWLAQVHGTDVVPAGSAGICADASISSAPGLACVVMTADCLPVLFCNRSGTRVAAAHAGWRGLLAGVLEATMRGFDDPAVDLLAWLGPAIGPEAFEVGDEVKSAFMIDDPATEADFQANGPGHWLADIYGLARRRLHTAGVTAVTGGEHCTVSEPERFFSYRREGITGRMASLVWLQAPASKEQGDGE